MLILKRFISPYDGESLILGIFSSLEKLEESKRIYMEFCGDYDSYAVQAYRSVDLGNDIVVLSEFNRDIDSSFSETFYLVYKKSESFGQTVKDIVCIYDSKSKAELRCMELRTEKSEHPTSYGYDIFVLNTLLFEQESLFVRFREALIENNTIKMSQYLERGFNYCEINTLGKSILHSIVEEDLEVIRRAVELGFDINACDKNGWSFLYLFRKYNKPTQENLVFHSWLERLGCTATPNLFEDRWKNT